MMYDIYSIFPIAPHNDMMLFPIQCHIHIIPTKNEINTLEYAIITPQHQMLSICLYRCVYLLGSIEIIQSPYIISEHKYAFSDHLNS